jgi:hypothetical protein
VAAGLFAVASLPVALMAAVGGRYGMWVLIVGALEAMRG